MNKFSRKSLSRMQGVHPDLQAVMIAAVSECPVDFSIVEGVRTMKRQQELYQQGRTKPGKVVTEVDGVRRKSKHQTGRAVDICPYVDGKMDWNNIPAFNAIGAHVKKIASELNVQIKWGGEWGWDKPHFELK